MIIKKMTAYFGALDGKSLELGRGLNVLYAPNESGKSTWCAFLRAMLYGVDTAQRAKQGQHPDKVKYRPWSGAPMSGSMDIETADGPVTLRRWTERSGQPMQMFSATVTGTEEPVAGMTGESAGRILTGAPREVFERSAFIHQSGLGVTADPELEKRFAAIVSAGDEEQSYSETDERLRAWLRRRRSGRRGAIPETEGEIARVREELARIGEASQAVERLERELTDAQTRQEKLVRQMEQARAEARKKALADYQAAKRNTEEAAGALSRAQEEKNQSIRALTETPFGTVGPDVAKEQAEQDRADAEELFRRADAMPPRWPMFIPLGAGVLLLLLAPFGRMTLSLVVGGAAFLALAGGLYFWSKDVEKRRDALLDEASALLESYGADGPEGISEALDRYLALCGAAKEATRKQTAAEQALGRAQQAQKDAEEPVLNGLDFVNGDNEAARASQAVTAGQERMDQLREQRAMAEGRVKALGDEMVLRSDLTELESRRKELLAQEAALSLAQETLAQADLGLREKFSPVLAQRAAALFSALTDGRYDEITLARDLSAKARLTGDAVGWEADYLSQGARDQLYLALRLAVCELVLPPEQACPIILDDALAAFDRERMGRALELLKQVAEKRQVLLFSCHERESEYFAQDGGVLVQRL